MKKKTDLKFSELEEGFADPKDLRTWKNYVAGKTKKLPGWKTVTIQLPSPAELRAFRKKASMTQVGLAKAMNTSPRAVQQWEQGLRKLEGPAALLMRLFEIEPGIMDRAAKLAAGLAR